MKELDEYQQLAARTATRKPDQYPRWLQMIEDPWAKQQAQVAWDRCNWAMGLGEAGEVLDYLKKVFFHGKQMDPAKLEEELGDLLWYVANTARTFGLTLSQVAAKNIDKLRKRYPAGFDQTSANARADEHKPGCTRTESTFDPSCAACRQKVVCFNVVTERVFPFERAMCPMHGCGPADECPGHMDGHNA